MNKNSSIPLIATIIVAALAIAAVVIAIVTINASKGSGTQSGQQGSDPAVSEFRPTQELVEECTYAAHDLVAGSYKIVRLFVTEGLAHYGEPYGNEPEDGIYTVNSQEYTDLSQIEELVYSVYTNSEAERILKNIDGNGMAVYRDREILVDDDSTVEGTSDSSHMYKTDIVLGISADFAPDTEYAKDWSSCRIAVLPRSEMECELTVYLDGLDENSEVTEENKGSVLEIPMIKVDGEWRLALFTY